MCNIRQSPLNTKPREGKKGEYDNPMDNLLLNMAGEPVFNYWLRNILIESYVKLFPPSSFYFFDHTISSNTPSGQLVEEDLDYEAVVAFIYLFI